MISSDKYLWSLYKSCKYAYLWMLIYEEHKNEGIWEKISIEELRIFFEKIIFVVKRSINVRRIKIFFFGKSDSCRFVKAPG